MPLWDRLGQEPLQTQTLAAPVGAHVSAVCFETWPIRPSRRNSVVREVRSACPALPGVNPSNAPQR